MALLVVACVELGTLALVSETAPVDDGARFYAAGLYPTHVQSIVQWQTQRARTVPPAEVLIAGDSSALMGLAPREFHERLGRSTQNVAMVQPLGIEGQVDTVQIYLESHPPPALLVFQFSEPNLGLTSARIEQMGLLPGYRSWLGRDDSAGRLWPTYRLRTAARAAVGGHWYEPSFNDAAIREFLEREHGYFREAALAVDLGAVRAPDPSFTPDGLIGIERLFRLTRDAHTPVLLLHAPIPDTYRTPALETALARNEAQLRALAAPYPHVTVQGPFANFAPAEFFFDYQHLFVEGAIIHSAHVSTLVEPLLAPREPR